MPSNTLSDADVVVVNGDLMDGKVRDLGKAVAELGDIQSKQGVYFTTGNHEYISGKGCQNLIQLGSCLKSMFQSSVVSLSVFTSSRRRRG